MIRYGMDWWWEIRIKMKVDDDMNWKELALKIISCQPQQWCLAVHRCLIEGHRIGIKLEIKGKIKKSKQHEQHLSYHPLCPCYQKIANQVQRKRVAANASIWIRMRETYRSWIVCVTRSQAMWPAIFRCYRSAHCDTARIKKTSMLTA